MAAVVEVVVLVAAKKGMAKGHGKTSSETNEYLRILGESHNKNTVLCAKSYIWSPRL
jgi:hypothetical protein